MQVYLYSFKKRENSTAYPLPSEGKLFNVQLKNETSFLTPTLRMSVDNLTTGLFSPAAYNYAFIPYWQRYYYITDWNYTNACWECNLSVDVLASFKGEIGNTSAYIIRSASQYNGDILDSFYPTTTVSSITKQRISSEIYHTTIPGGCFVLGCVNNSASNRVGSITYYALTATELNNVLVYMFGSGIYQASNITEMGEGLYKSLFDPFQYIVSCMWFPYAANVVGDTVDHVKVGYWDTGVNGRYINLIVDEIGFKTESPIARHPQISRGSYLDHAPYTKITAYYPPFGEIPIDTNYMLYGANNYLYGKMFIDFVTGLANCYFTITNGYDTESTADPYKFMTMRTAQVGVPIQIAQVMSDYASAMQSIGGAVGNAFTWNFSGVFQNIIASYAADMPKVSTQGANGSLIEIIEPPYLIVEHKQVVDENLVEFGRPLCNNRTINTLAGFIQCGEDDHSFTATQTETERINRYLKEGFFYE